jgi:hypothetical protein
MLVAFGFACLVFMVPFLFLVFKFKHKEAKKFASTFGRLHGEQGKKLGSNRNISLEPKMFID